MVNEELLNKSFTINEILNNDLRKFTCWGSVEVKDRHGELIPAEEVYKIMDIWMDRGAPIQFNHTNRNVGRGLNWQPLEKNGKPGVLITAKIYDHYKEDDELWSDMKKGKFEGLSIGGKSYSKQPDEEGTPILRKLIGYEFSVVERCGNQEATMVDLNMMAKSDNQEKMVKKEDVKKEEPVVSEETTNEPTMADIMEAIANLASRMDAVEEKVSGEPAEEPVQEAEEEPEKEPAKEPEKEDMEKLALKKELSEIKKSLSEIKKGQVKEVIKGETPEDNEVQKKVSFNSVLDNKIEEMKKSGNINFKDVAKLIETQKRKELEEKFK